MRAVEKSLHFPLYAVPSAARVFPLNASHYIITSNTPCAGKSLQLSKKISGNFACRLSFMILCRSDTFFRKLLRSSRERVCINDIKRRALILKNQYICMCYINMNVHRIVA